MNTRFRFLALLTITILLLNTVQTSNHVLAASIIPVSNDSAGALTLAQAMVADPSTLTSAQFVAVPLITDPQPAAANGTSDALSFFPTQGTTFGIMTNGDALVADDPNDPPIQSSNGEAEPVPNHGDNAFDGTILKIDLNAPTGTNCLRFDFAFYSDDYPYWLSGPTNPNYNDTFIAELDQSTWLAIDGDNPYAPNTLEAPNNFAFDQAGNVVSIKSIHMTDGPEINASGTTYNGATDLLQAATPVTSGAHSLYLTIFDEDDVAVDSAVFVDNIRFETVANPATDCGPTPPPP